VQLCLLSNIPTIQCLLLELRQDLSYYWRCSACMFGTEAVPETTLALWVKKKSFANRELKLGVFVQRLAKRVATTYLEWRSRH